LPPSPNPKKEFNFHFKDPRSFGNANVAEKEREFKEKLEKYVWACVPADKRFFV
jgi:hypothetical protein